MRAQVGRFDMKTHKHTHKILFLSSTLSCICFIYRSSSRDPRFFDIWKSSGTIEGPLGNGTRSMWWSTSTIMSAKMGKYDFMDICVLTIRCVAVCWRSGQRGVTLVSPPLSTNTHTYTTNNVGTERGKFQIRKPSQFFCLPPVWFFFFEFF